MNNNLTGIVIDPGHGGVDGGAVGNNQTEKDYTLKISKYMYDRFKQLGIPVTLTRDIDVTLTPTDRTKKIIDAYGNDQNVIVISNHLNAGGGTGAEVIYALRNSNSLADSVLENIGLTGQSTRRTYQRTLPSNPSKDYYFIHRDTGNTEPLIIEYGFIDDKPTNVQFLNNNYKEIAEAVIKSVLEYKNIPYTPPANIQTPVTPNQNNTYLVKKGDTLYSLAKQYNTTVDELKQLNNLANNTLSIGQILKVPTSTTNTYTVKSGDTLYSIATKNNTTVDRLKQLNNLISNILSIGQTLILPDKEIIEIPTTNTYTVKSGDTLYSIAKQYNTTVDAIKQLNNITSNTLSIGNVLKIPTSDFIETPTTTITYTVTPGDTLYSIARTYNTTVNNIKELNNLTSNILTVGQKLLISP